MSENSIVSMVNKIVPLSKPVLKRLRQSARGAVNVPFLLLDIPLPEKIRHRQRSVVVFSVYKKGFFTDFWGIKKET